MTQWLSVTAVTACGEEQMSAHVLILISKHRLCSAHPYSSVNVYIIHQRVRTCTSAVKRFNCGSTGTLLFFFHIHFTLPLIGRLTRG